MPSHHYHYHNHHHHCHQHLGLGLVGPILLNTVTAPAERVRLFLQCQDEVILNMRQESKAQQRTIMAHAQLPYKDMRDCVDRLVEKEGTESLWRGYSIEVGRYVVQSGIEAWMRRTAFRRLFRLSKDQYGYIPWFTGLALSGTIANSISLLLVYPLMTLHTRVATDVVRKSHKVARKIIKSEKDKPAVSPALLPASMVASATSTIPLEDADHELSDTELVQSLDETDVRSFSSAVDEQQEDQQLAQKEEEEEEDEEAEPVQAYELAYKYENLRGAYDEISETEGYLGLYKGLSTVVLSTFVSRVGFLAMFDLMSPILVQAGPGRGLAAVGPLVVVFGATSLLTLAIYPLSTIGHRRMIAAPGRYSSSWDAAQKIYEKQGWRAFFNGVEVAILRSAAIAVLSRVL
ncbi:hypothetical protein DFQ26_009880 [Actinomortierella ambigua]|nr:hypothetical protein DFQ26_009880 [Actinomortierella ambigua]